MIGGEQPLNTGQMADVENLGVQHLAGKHWSFFAQHRKDQGDLKDLFVNDLGMSG